VTWVGRRTSGFLLIAIGLAGLTVTAWAAAAARGAGAGPTILAPYGAPPHETCVVPALPGQAVDVVLADMGGMMSSGQMMSVTASPSTVGAGQVSFRVSNSGMMLHELVVLPLPEGRIGSRPVGSEGQVSEAASVGEASRSCGEGSGGGIAPGTTSWITLNLAPGRYELICNLPGHYAMGMFTELDVR
jgi:uncharacterized cupredoxin-like copper-binding protein